MSGYRLEVGQIGGTPLLDRLLAGDPALTALYGGDPRSLDAYREKLAELGTRFDRAARARAAAALTPTSARARERLARFVEEGGAMVTTGQQAGLFTGPMYTVNKAATAARLAEELERRLGVLVIPVFWVASEDHDFAEVNHAWAVDGEGTLRRPSVRATTAVAVPMSEMRLGPDVDEALSTFVQAVDGHGVAEAYRSALGEAYRPGETVAGAFSATLLRLLAPLDICLTDAAHPALKQASREILRASIAEAADHERRVAERTARTQALGLTPPVTLVEESTNLFFHGRAGRERLHRDGDAIVAAEAGERFAAAELEAAIAADPGRFSPNVLLRPVVESAVFPTLAYVGGPAETGYFAQIGGLFEGNGIRPPLAFPRFAARVVPDPVEEARRGLDLAEAVLALPEHEVLERVARARLPEPVAGALAALRAELVGRFGALADATAPIDPNLVPALGARRNRAMLEIAAAERKILRHLKRQPGLAGRVRLVRNHLRPNGAPQERVLTIFQYLGENAELVSEIASRIRIDLRG
jgi:bacillithiol biosynthesis cysteine-adding enzyme BshC